jgi:hypothetical protein
LRRRRGVAIFAASLLAHAALLGAWMATRPPERFAEPPAMQVSLVTPPRTRALPERKPQHNAPSSARSAGERPAPQEAAPPPPGEPTATAAPVAPRVLSDEELLRGRSTDAGKLHEALNQRRHRTKWDGCNKLPGPPDWTAPPCPPSGSNEEAKHVLSRPDLQGHDEGARRDRIRAYKDGTGPYPGVACVMFHKC